MIAPTLLASTAIILLSFVSEDAATISSALSLFGGPINWQLGFAACYAGIWLGDLGLYSLARCLGKPILIAAGLRDLPTRTQSSGVRRDSTITLRSSCSPAGSSQARVCRPIWQPECSQCRLLDLLSSRLSPRSYGSEESSPSQSCSVLRH